MEHAPDASSHLPRRARAGIILARHGRADDAGPPSPDPSRYSWSELMCRVFGVDVQTCKHCGERRRSMALISDTLHAKGKTARVAGNFENTDILGSMEFATKVSGAKLVLVLGHTECGAVKAAIGGVELGNITAMIANINTAVERCADFNGEQSASNAEFLRMVTAENVRVTMADIRELSPILSEMADAGEIIIAGAIHDMGSGEVQFLE